MRAMGATAGVELLSSAAVVSGACCSCTLMCSIRLTLLVKLLSHCSHVNGVLECERLCDTRWPLHVKSLGHWSHLNGRTVESLLCDRWWNSKLPLSGNDLPHSVHAYGRSPVWQRMWFTRCSFTTTEFVRSTLDFLPYHNHLLTILIYYLTPNFMFKLSGYFITSGMQEHQFWV